VVYEKKAVMSTTFRPSSPNVSTHLIFSSSIARSNFSTASSNLCWSKRSSPLQDLDQNQPKILMTYLRTSSSEVRFVAGKLSESFGMSPCY
jgi:hypothetical protein